MVPLSELMVHESEVPKGEQQAGDSPDPGNARGVSAWRFRLTVLQHHKAVFRVCLGILADEHEAEDVTQEAFLKYWQIGNEVRGARGWLITVARNKCLDRLRGRKRFVDADPEVFEQQTEPHGPEWHAKRGELNKRLGTLINRLPEPQRSLVLMFDVEGLTGAECASALNLNANQVKVYLHRARRQLRRALENVNE